MSGGAIPIGEIAQVLWCLGWGSINLREWVLANRFLNDSREAADPSSLQYAASIYRTFQVVFTAIQLYSVLTGLAVIRWRFDHEIAPAVALPYVTRTSTILFTSIGLALLSAMGPAQRRRMRRLMRLEAARDTK